VEAAAPEPEEQVIAIDLRRYLAALRKYVWLLAALIVLSIAGAVIYTTTQTPVYQATASVQVEPKLPDVLGTGVMPQRVAPMSLSRRRQKGPTARRPGTGFPTG